MTTATQGSAESSVPDRKPAPSSFGFLKGNPQLTKNGELKHLLTIEGLPRAIVTHILDTAEQFVSVTDREIKKVPLLRGKSVFNLFFENSTRTRTTFEIAAKRLSADVINLNINASSTSKGESLLDTINNLSAMHADMFVVRHASSGAPYLIAEHCAPHVHVKVRTYAGRDVTLSFATQLFFDDAVSGAVFAGEPYAAHGRSPVTNAHDDFFDHRTLVRLAHAGDGYSGTIALGIRRG